MKGKKLITLSIITSSLLFLSGCNEFGNGEHSSSNLHNDTYISNDTNTEDLQSITIDGIKTISPILVTGNTQTENDTITVYVYDENGNLVETLIATIDENGDWISTTSKLDNGDYKFKAIDKNSNEVKDLIFLSTYIRINNIQDITKFPYLISGFTSLYRDGEKILYPSNLRLEVVKIEKGKKFIVKDNGSVSYKTYSPIKTVVEVFENIKPSSSGKWSQMIEGRGGYNNLEETSTHYSSQYYVSVNNEDEIQDEIYFRNRQYSYSNYFNVNLEEVVTEIEIIKEIQYIDSNSTLDLSIKGNSTTGTILSGSVSDNITSMLVEIRDNQDTLIDSQTPTINQDFTWENNSINLSDGTYSYKILLNKTDGGEVVINGGFDVDNTLFVSVNQINNQTNGTFNINGSVSLDMTSIVVSIVDSDTNSLVTTIGATSVNDTYEVTTNNLADGNYEVYTTVQDDIGNSKVSNIVSFNINSEVVEPDTIECLGMDDGDITEDGYTVVYDKQDIWNLIASTSEDYSVKVCVSNVTDFSGLMSTDNPRTHDFYDFKRIYEINNWDTSSVTDMSYAIGVDDSSVDDVDFNEYIGSWDTSSVTNMEGMFAYYGNFNQYIGNWDVSNVTNMKDMFRKSIFNQNINNWDTSSVTNMEGMFSVSRYNHNLDFWDVSNVTNMKEMFYYNRTFKGNINNWDTSSVTNMEGMFRKSIFNQPIGDWDVSNVTNMKDMFSSWGELEVFNQDISNWDVSNVTNMYRMFMSSEFNQPIGDWDTSSLTNMIEMFSNSQFNQNINNWDVSNVTNMYRVFNVSEFNQPIGDWDVSNVTNMKEMFRESKFNQPIGDWDVSNVTDMEEMFGSYYKWNQYGTRNFFSQDLSSWDVSNVTNMYGMFANSTFNGNISSWDVSNVTNMCGMFHNDDEFNQYIGNWDVSNVTDMSYLMHSSHDFNQNLSLWNVSNVTNNDGYDFTAYSWEDINKPIFP